MYSRKVERTEGSSVSWIHGRAEGSVNGNALAGCDVLQQGQIGVSTFASTRVHHERCSALGGHSVERHSGEVINAFSGVRALPVFEMCKNNSIAGDWSGGSNVKWRLKSWVGMGSSWIRMGIEFLIRTTRTRLRRGVGMSSFDDCAEGGASRERLALGRGEANVRESLGTGM